MLSGVALSLLLSQAAPGAQPPQPIPAAPARTVRVWYWPPSADHQAPTAKAPAPASSRPSTEDVRFAANSSKFNPAGDSLVRLAEWLKANPGARVTLHGYSDPRGAQGPNAKLSERRAEAVRDALVKAGAPGAQVTAVGHGAVDPVQGTTTEETEQLSRRVTFEITESPAPKGKE